MMKTGAGANLPYEAMFHSATGFATPPFDYQRRLAEDPWPDTLNVPTGLGKTAAVVLAWTYKRRVLNDGSTPRRLVICLPMRVLVEQTETSVRQWLQNLKLLGDAGQGRVSVHVLMGGSEDVREATWGEHPEEDMVLIGTQDMLLSRALMRGYGMSRYQWPVHFAWLHNDALWVFDEVQLMGPGLATAAQLEAFRRALPSGRSSRSLWVSATLRPDWLATVDFRSHVPALRQVSLGDRDQVMPLVRERVNALKRVVRSAVKLDGESAKQKCAAYLGALAEAVRVAHRGGTTLVIVNTVDRAQGLYRELEGGEVPLLLLHARFRARERRVLERRLRDKPPPKDRIVIATQAVEAGVDITSRVLFTELAPWPSIVQRFGRCNRYGEENERGGADSHWIDVAEEKECAAPYRAEELESARTKLAALSSASPGTLPGIDEPAPLVSVLRRRDLFDLFDTDRDLSGFDVDVSGYIRDTGTPQIQVFWRSTDGDPNEPLQPPAARDELCPVSIGQAQGLAKRKGWVWDTLGRRWRAHEGFPRPGVTLMLEASEGGYDPALGFTLEGKAGKKPVEVLESDAEASVEAMAEDWRSRTPTPVALPDHLGHVAEAARALCDALGETTHGAAVVRAGRWHDVGKAHHVFQQTMHACPQVPPSLLAKSPCRGRHPRRYFRHEVASLLAWLDRGERSDAHDLVAFLVAAHHGKVRMSLRSMPDEDPTGQVGFVGQRFARGVWEGDVLPALEFDGESLPQTSLRLAVMELGEGEQGASWTERTQRLLAAHGPFRLAWLEALVRVADWRASRAEQAGVAGAAPEENNDRDGLPASGRGVAKASRGGADTPPMGPDPAQRGREHGLRGRAGEPRGSGSRTRPATATRFVETTLGILSYAELAPRLAVTVLEIEEAIVRGAFADRRLDEQLLEDPHRRVCGDLVPQLAGMIATACESIGLPRPREVIVTSVSAHLGVPPAHAFPRLRRKDDSERRHAHAILVFDRPVRGPILLGAGRYRGYGAGYGVCRPIREGGDDPQQGDDKVIK